MAERALVIGAGLGGLAAALALARRGLAVRILEARTDIGGLAGGVEHAGFCFDGGPYILLDQPGLAWGFAALGLNLAEHVPLRRIEDASP